MCGYTQEQAHKVILLHNQHARLNMQRKRNREEQNEQYQRETETRIKRINIKKTEHKELYEKEAKLRADKEKIKQKENSRRYQCPYCDLSQELFTEGSNNLKCDYASYWNGNFQRHIQRIHSGETGLRRKMREKECEQFFKNNNISYQREVTTSKFLRKDDSCTSKARLDFTLNLWSDINVILEVDEHQHKDYVISCELARMHNITESFVGDGNQNPTLIIRFNPDSYKIHSNGKLPGGRISLKNRYVELWNFLQKKPVLTSGPHLYLAYFYYSYDREEQCPRLFASDTKFFEERNMTKAEVESLKLLKPNIIFSCC